MKPSLVTPILQKTAKKIGVDILVEPEYGYAGQLVFPNGKRHYFKDACLDINPAGAAEIARDKAYATFFMQQMGYPTIEGKVFFSKRWENVIRKNWGTDAACEYAGQLGFPVILKPNDLSQGIGIQKIYSARELRTAIRNLPLASRAYLIQRFIRGNDYRIVVLDDEVICAYQRFPLCVTGDGKASILTLLKCKQAQFEKTGRITAVNLHDPRISKVLRRQKLTLDSIPERGKNIRLLDNANLSSGGNAIDVTDSTHPHYKAMAVKLTKDMGLRLCGVDIITQDDISTSCGSYHIIEVNASPGLDHFADLGTKQRRIQEDLYRRILIALSR